MGIMSAPYFETSPNFHDVQGRNGAPEGPCPLTTRRGPYPRSVVQVAHLTDVTAETQQEGSEGTPGRPIHLERPRGASLRPDGEQVHTHDAEHSTPWARCRTRGEAASCLGRFSVGYLLGG